MTQPTWNQALAENWGKYPPPIRPSNSCTRLFELFIKQKMTEDNRKPKILLLGSTPELRDLCHTMSAPITIVDFSAENFHALSRLLKTPPRNEHFVEQDWQSMELHEAFDIVLAEASLNVVPAKGIAEVLRRIRKHMAPNSVFIAKTWVIPRRFLSLEETIREYRKYYSTDDFYSFACGFLWLHYYDWEKQIVSLRRMNYGISRLYEAGEIDQSELESVRRLEYPDVDLELHFPRRSDLLDHASSLFNLEAVALSDFTNSFLYPFFFFRAK